MRDTLPLNRYEVQAGRTKSIYWRASPPSIPGGSATPNLAVDILGDCGSLSVVGRKSDLPASTTFEHFPVNSTKWTRHDPSPRRFRLDSAHLYPTSTIIATSLSRFHERMGWVVPTTLGPGGIPPKAWPTEAGQTCFKSMRLSVMQDQSQETLNMRSSTMTEALMEKTLEKPIVLHWEGMVRGGRIITDLELLLLPRGPVQPRTQSTRLLTQDDESAQTPLLVHGRLYMILASNGLCLVAPTAVVLALRVFDT